MMKTLICLISFSSFFLFACKQETPITPLAPGEDKNAPTITIQSPTESAPLIVEKGKNAMAQIEVKDDIELKDIQITVDGNAVISDTKFKDYRVAKKSYDIGQLTGGAHTLRVQATDLSGKTEKKDINFSVALVSPYTSQFQEALYIPFEDNYLDLINFTIPGVVGNPTFSGSGKKGKSYQGAADSYLTIPIEKIPWKKDISIAFWYKPVLDNNAGLLTVGAPHEGADADKQNNRNHGFRLFRDGGAKIKANMGVGAADRWVDGGDNGIVVVNEWVHITLAIAYDATSDSTEIILYLNGASKATNKDKGAISWENCNSLSIMSGEPYFNEWGHKSDASLMDELYIFDRALKADEVKKVMAAAP